MRSRLLTGFMPANSTFPSGALYYKGMDELHRSFPKNFYWGAATSAHQVGGGNCNDWTEWEKSESRIKNLESRIKGENFRKQFPDYILKNWPSPLDTENYISGKACDHYNRFREDFDIAKELGHNAHRFSIEWSRIEPEEGKFDEKEIEHYREVIRALRERGVEPFVTLWHFTLPLWIAKQGGWASRKTVDYFTRFAERISREFKDEVVFWITVNEPGAWAADAYLFGIKPPARHNPFLLNRAYWNLHRAHVRAYRAMKSVNPRFEIGVAESMEYLGGLGGIFAGYLRNFFFLHTVDDALDFIGVNYYKRARIFGRARFAVSDMGLEIFPEGLYKVLKGAYCIFRKPIFITENGLADARDIKRGKFIEDHIRAVEKAIKEGVDVRGYFHWSLLDNFEWQDGFWPRFGLIEVDYRTQARKIRESAYAYSGTIKNVS